MNDERNYVLQIVAYHYSPNLIPCFFVVFFTFFDGFQIGVSDSSLDISTNCQRISVYQNLSLGVEKQRQIKF